MADLSVTLGTGLGRPDPDALGAIIAEGATAAARALRLAAPAPLTVGVTSGDVEDGPFRVTAGEVTITGSPTGLGTDATAVEVADLITGTICAQRAILCAATGTTDPGAIRLAGLGAAIPDAPMPAAGLDRACEQILAARTTPVLSVGTAADLPAAIDGQELSAKLDQLRQWILKYLGVPVPVIGVDVAGLAPGRIRVTLLDTPFEAGAAGKNATDAVLDTLRDVALANLPSLLTSRGVDLLLGSLARTDPWLVHALDHSRYDRIDLTGILRELLAAGLPVTGLRPVLERLVSLTGPVDAAAAWNTLTSLACAYYPADAGGEAAYQATASVVGPFTWQYSGHGGLAGITWPGAAVG
jgi:hypothetical protein